MIKKLTARGLLLAAGVIAKAVVTRNGCARLKIVQLAMLLLLVLTVAPAAWAGSASLKANDASGTTSFTGSSNWTIAGVPNATNDYYTSTFYMRTPSGGSGTTYTFGGNSLTLQAYASANARSMIFKGASGDVLIINNFTNAAGGLINEGSGTAGFSIGGNLWTIAGNSTLAADQNGPLVINSPLAGSANFTNSASAAATTITYNGTNSAFTGKLIVNNATVVFNSVSNVLGNPGSSTPDQYTLASATLRDNAGVTLNAANSGVTLAAAATINTATAGTNTVIAVPIAGAFTLTKSGAGTLTLSAANTFSGLTATAGQINLNNATALGATEGVFNINGVATIDNKSGGAITNDNNNPVTISQSFTFAGSYDLNLGTGDVDNGSSAKTITVSAGKLTFGGAFTGSGQVVKAGNGTLLLNGASTGIDGGLLVNAGTLLVNGSTASGSVVSVGAGCYLGGTGTIGGDTTVSNTAALIPGTLGTYGTNTFNSSLTLVSGAACYLDVGTVYNGTNDQIVVSGNLTLSGNSIHIKAPNISANLDTNSDYVLITAGGISGNFSSTPVWDVPPANSNNFSVVTSGTTVTLYYSTFTPPTGSGFATPTPAFHNQNVLISVTVTNGSGTVDPDTGVVLNAATLDGSLSSVPLVLSSTISGTVHVYTNTITVPGSAAAGSYTLSAVITDSNGLIGTANISLTVSTTEVWNGGGSSTNLNWSNDPNWVVGMAPELSGDSLIFAGTVGTAPNMDNNYSLTGLTFSNNAASFTIGSTTGSTLTLAGGVTNNSANAQTLNVPITMSAPQTFNAAAGSITVSGAIDDSGNGYDLTKTGNGTLVLSGTNTYTGPTLVSAGTLNVEGSVTPGYVTVGNVAGKSVLNISGNLAATNLYDGNFSGAASAIYQTGGTVTLANGAGDLLNVGNVTGSYGYYNAVGGTLNVNGISIGGENNSASGTGWPPVGSGDGVFEVNGATINNSGWVVLARGGAAETGILNVYSGSLSYAGGGIGCNWQTTGSGQTSIINIMGGSVTSTTQGVNFRATDTGILNLNGGVLEGTGVSGPGTVNFNGGTLQAPANSGGFLSVNAASIYSGGATIDNNGYAITIGQALLAPTGNGIHSASVTSGGAGYIAPPIITITNATGDTTGKGATAIAKINPLTGAVTNVIVTCPGVNYTATPIFVVSGGGATTPAVITGGAPAPNTSGGLTSIGNGTLTLTAANTFNGAVVVNGGTLYANKANSAASGVFTNVSSITVNSGATLESYINSLFGWDASMAKPITVNAGGTLISDTGIDVNVGLVTLNGGTLAGDNTTSGWGSWNFGAAAAAGKKLAVTDNSTVTAINVVMHSGTVIDVASGKTLTFSGTISDNNADISAVIKTNTGTLILSGANTYTGDTTVNGGTLELAQAVLATNSTVSIASGAKLQLDFSTTNIVTAIVLNGVAQPSGIYNSNTVSAYITGPGSLIIPSTGPGTFTSTPGITSFKLNGANVAMTVTNGQAGDAYYLLSSTNLSLPLNQWRAVATNVPVTSGTFTFTGTNVVTPGDPLQFYILSNTNYNH